VLDELGDHRLTAFWHEWFTSSVWHMNRDSATVGGYSRLRRSGSNASLVGRLKKSRF
jgi:hypothetical protein